MAASCCAEELYFYSFSTTLVKILALKRNYTSSESASCQACLESSDFQENQAPQTLQEMGEADIF